MDREVTADYTRGFRRRRGTDGNLIGPTGRRRRDARLETRRTFDDVRRQHNYQLTPMNVHANRSAAGASPQTPRTGGAYGAPLDSLVVFRGGATSKGRKVGEGEGTEGEEGKGRGKKWARRRKWEEGRLSR